ncbi:Protein phosphatase methylesterase 1, partial [Modicella reniformis]
MRQAFTGSPVRVTEARAHEQDEHNTTYGLVIDVVFDLERQGEAERFADVGFSKFHNRRLLWHGNRLTNYVGILSQGL